MFWLLFSSGYSMITAHVGIHFPLEGLLLLLMMFEKFYLIWSQIYTNLQPYYV